MARKKSSKKKTTAGRPAKAYSQAERMIRIYLKLLYSPGITTEGAMACGDRGERTARRDMAALEHAGVPLIIEELDNGDKIWRILDQYRRNGITLNRRERYSLLMAKNFFDFLDGTPFEEDIKTIYDRLETGMKDKDRTIREDFRRKYIRLEEPAKNYLGSDDTFNELVTGLFRNEKVRLLYRKVGAPRSERYILCPYSIVTYRHGVYIIGWADNRDGMRVFAVERIKKAKWLRGKSFEYPDDYEPLDYFDGAFGLVAHPDAPVTAVNLEFSKQSAPYVLGRSWHPTQKFKKMKNGRVRLSMDVRGLWELEFWILSWGKNVKVLSPKSLKAKIKDHARGMLKG